MRRGALVAVVGVALALAACRSSRPSADAGAVERFAATGWAAHRYPIRTERLSLAGVDGAIVAILAMPQAGGPHPLVIFLPGLGQGAEPGPFAGAWAEAGYAVLTIQPLDEDADAWSSSEAHRGDFHAVAQRRFGAAAMAARLRALAHAIDRFRRDVGAAAIDWNRVALAGYDLGAYAAMVAGGEFVAGVEPGGLPFRPRAVVALSPLGDPDGLGPPASRFAAVGEPVLWISGRNDADGYGMTSAPEARRAAFGALPPGDKFLLWLADGAHRQVGGELIAEAPVPEVAAPRTLGRRPSPAARDDEDAEEAFLFHGDRNRIDDDARAALLAAGSQTMTQRALGIAIVRVATIAFLDGFVADDAAAREWLLQRGPRWMQPMARLETR